MKQPQMTSPLLALRFVLASVGLLLFPIGFAAAADPTNCVTPPSGLVAWWPAEGNANDIIGGYNGTISNGITFVVGEVAQAFSFNGVDQFITNATPGLTNILNSYTMEFWAWPTAGRASTPETTSGSNVTTNQRYAVFPANGRFGPAGSGVSVGTNGVSVFEHASAYGPALLVYDTVITNWTHVAVVYSNQQPQLYLNGVLMRTGLTSTRSSYPSTCLGESGYGYGYYAGRLDEVSIYDRALLPAEVLSIYIAGGAGKCGPPAPPFIITQPTNQTVVVGGTATFSVTAGGTPPLSYQWKFNDSALTNATNFSLILAHVQPDQAGLYSVQVTNSLGSTNSTHALLTIGSGPPTCAAPAPGMVAWWPAEGNGDDIVGTNDASLVNGVTFTNGEVAQAFNLNGTSAYLAVSGSPSLNVGVSAGLTFECWLNPADLSAPVALAEWNNSAGLAGVHLWLSQPPPYGTGTGCIYANLIDTVGNFHTLTTSAGILKTNAFQHVALTYDKTSGALNLYCSGEPAATNAAGGFTPQTTYDFYLGKRVSGLPPGLFRGQIDEASLYNRALTAPEIQAIYNAGANGKCQPEGPPFILVQPTNQTVFEGQTAAFTVLAGGARPLSYQWTFNGTRLAGATETSLILYNVQSTQAGPYAVEITNFFGSTNSSNAVLTVNPAPPCSPPSTNLVSWWRAENNALDQVGDNHGVLSGGATFSAGRVGQAFAFNGLGSSVTLSDLPNLRIQNFTIEAWIKRASTNQTSLNGNGNGHIFGYNNGGYGLYLDPSGYPTLTKVGINNTPASVPITDTNFHHLAVTKSNSTVIFYIDGTNYPAAAYDPGFTFNTPLYIGGLGNNYTFYGLIDEVSIYSRPLSAAEIQAIYGANLGGKCRTPVPPFLVSGPNSQTTTVGGTVTFSAAAAGSVPLSYQWQFKGIDIPAATNSALTLANVQMNQAGNYSLVVTNIAGSARSTNALLTVNFPAAQVRLNSTNTTAGANITLPVILVANGNENAIGFSVSFSPSRLTFTSANLGSGAAGANLNLNTSQINSGFLGLGINLPPNATFSPGTQIVAQISFTVSLVPSPSSTTINFGDQPDLRQLLDPQLNTLPATYAGATITVAAALGFEGDVAPRPAGDRAASLGDWLLLGRYVARLDYPTNASEFQRADCAPRASSGDGAIKVTDWVQTGRYAFGLDGLSPMDGPTTEIAVPPAGPSATRLVTSGGGTFHPGGAVMIPVNLAAQGNENALSFSLSFDPLLVAFSGASLGSGGAGATLFVNTSQAASGSVGFVLGLSTGTTFAAGAKELVRVSFMALSTGSFSTGFADQPVPREISDTSALALLASYTGGAITINPSPPSLRIALSNTNILLVWPVSATNYLLQEIGALAPLATWTNLPVTSDISNNERVVTLPITNTARFYRLYQQ